MGEDDGEWDRSAPPLLPSHPPPPSQAANTVSGTCSDIVADRIHCDAWALAP